MKTGRPPLWNPVASFGRPVWTDVLPLASKGRIALPVFVRATLGWLTAEEGLLALVETGRHAEILPWIPNGQSVIADLKLTIDAADEREKDELALAGMDRVIRLSVDAAGRTSLPGPLAFHVDAEISQCVRVVMRDGRLWFWSERRWQEERGSRIALLSNRVKSTTAPPAFDGTNSIPET